MDTATIASKVKSPWVIGSAALAAGILGYAYWHRRAGAAETPVADPDAVGVGGYAPAPSADSTLNQEPPEGMLTTNDQWAQAAAERMAGYGWDPAAVVSALGRFLARLPLTQQEAEIVTTARALTGEPPVGGPWGIIPALPVPSPAPVTPPPAVTPPPPVASAGRTFTIPPTWPGQGTSQIMDRVMKSHSYNDGIRDRAGLDKIWYHPNNAALRAKRANDWSKLRAPDTIFIPY